MHTLQSSETELCLTSISRDSDIMPSTSWRRIRVGGQYYALKEIPANFMVSSGRVDFRGFGKPMGTVFLPAPNRSKFSREVSTLHRTCSIPQPREKVEYVNKTASKLKKIFVGRSPCPLAPARCRSRAVELFGVMVRL
jgi:hypothetical protein